MIKIQGDHTRPTDAPTLCESCRHATMVRGTRFGDDFIQCTAMEPSMLIRFTVAACSSYSDKAVPSVYVYQESAWLWMPDIDRFLSPNEKYRAEVLRHQQAKERKQKAEAAPPISWWRRLIRKYAA